MTEFAYPPVLKDILDIQADLKSKRIRTRKIAGKQVKYLPSHQVVNDLNGDFGLCMWESEVLASTVLFNGDVKLKVWENGRPLMRDRKQVYRDVPCIIASATVKLTVHDNQGECRSYASVGTWEAYGGYEGAPPFSLAVLGAESSALRRAASHLGNRYGNSLRDREDEHGRAAAAQFDDPDGTEQPPSPNVGAPPQTAAQQPQQQPQPQPQQDRPPVDARGQHGAPPVPPQDSNYGMEHWERAVQLIKVFKVTTGQYPPVCLKYDPPAIKRSIFPNMPTQQVIEIINGTVQEAKAHSITPVLDEAARLGVDEDIPF